MAVGDHSRARVLYRLPEQRRLGAGGLPGMLAMTVLALVLFLGGLLVGRATTRGTAAGPPAAAPATSAAGARAPGATTPDAAATPQAQAGGATAEGVGPRRVEHGVPVGYQHSEQGAVAAAANYVKVLSSTLVLDQASRRKAIDTIAAPEARGRLQRAFGQDVGLLAKALGVTAGSADAGTVLLRAVPVGWRVEKYSGDRATVAIWITSVGGSLGDPPRGMPVREAWGTTTVQLRWVDGDWKQLDTTITDGPVPIADAAPPTEASRLIPQAQEFKEFTYAPGS